MYRVIPKASRTSSPLCRSIGRISSQSVRISASSQTEQLRKYSAHAISNPTLASIEKRWEGMPPQEQAELWMSLRDRMKTDWHELTTQEKKAAYWIAFGPHGPRALPSPGENAKVFWYTMAGLAVSTLIFGAIRMVSGGDPDTMTKEWQEATNEYLKAQNSEPITGISAEGYVGPGHVQSKPKKKD